MAETEGASCPHLLKGDGLAIMAAADSGFKKFSDANKGIVCPVCATLAFAAACGAAVARSEFDRASQFGMLHNCVRSLFMGFNQESSDVYYQLTKVDTVEFEPPKGKLS